MHVLCSGKLDLHEIFIGKKLVVCNFIMIQKLVVGRFCISKKLVGFMPWRGSPPWFKQSSQPWWVIELKTKTKPNGQKMVPVWVRFGVQLGLRQTLALIKSAKNTKKQKNRCSFLLHILRALNECRCLPKAELNTKTNPNGHHSVAVWVRFGVHLDYSCPLKSVPSNAINRVEDLFRHL